MRRSSTALHRVLLLTTLAVVLAPCQASKGAESKVYDLSPDGDDRRVVRVDVHLEVGGSVTAETSTAAPGVKGQAPQKLPMSVEADLRYHEQPLDHTRSVRAYEQAAAKVKVDRRSRDLRLPPERGLIVVDRAGERLRLFSPTSPLTRDDLDLIEVVGQTPAISGLLPPAGAPLGGSWQASPEAVCALLGLDSAEVCEVTATLDKANRGWAHFQMAGTVHGKSDGAETELDLRGEALFDRKGRLLHKLSLAIKERRAVGPATPGFEGVAKIEVTVSPLEGDGRLTEADRKLAREADPQVLSALLLEAPTQGLEAIHDRNWYVTANERERVSLRRVVEGKLVAQTTLQRLPGRGPDRRTTLAEFEKDVRFSLGESFKKAVSSRQWTTSQGVLCLSLVSQGEVSGAPVEWRHYLASPEDDGHRVAITTTIAQADAPLVGDADERLVDTLRLVRPRGPQETASRPDGPDARR